MFILSNLKLKWVRVSEIWAIEELKGTANETFWATLRFLICVQIFVDMFTERLYRRLNIFYNQRFYKVLQFSIFAFATIEICSQIIDVTDDRNLRNEILSKFDFFIWFFLFF